ncbi:MAG: histidinol dehydrogenase [Prevotella sp.]|nr:histidinol dehydrogenase [Prevotella sp.]
MDGLSVELHAFLIRLGKESNCISEQVEHYIEHMLHLLPLDQEKTLQTFYGICQQQQLTLKQMAAEKNMSEEALAQEIAHALRKLAVTPEWQMVKQVIMKE